MKRFERVLKPKFERNQVYRITIGKKYSVLFIPLVGILESVTYYDMVCK